MNNKPRKSTGGSRYFLKNFGAVTPLTAATVYLPLFSILAFFCALNVSAAEVDWNKVEARTIKIFYHGVASWEFMKGKDHGIGATPVKTLKKTCADCHVGKTGEYDINADQIISGELKKSKSKKRFEPRPVPGAPGFKDVALQVAYDAEKLYMRFQWRGSGASVIDPSLAKDDKAGPIPVQLNVQIADKLKSFRNYGCFISCHDDQLEMPANRGEYIKLYAYYTRNKDGKLKPQEKLDGYLAKGQFIDLWIAAYGDTEVNTADMYILHDRLEDQNDLSATGSFEDGTYTIAITRKLATGDPRDIVFTDGNAFSIGISIHDNPYQDRGRKHYVSLPVSIGLATAADISAHKL